MKSISELNNKWWYRFLKVFYIGFFLLVGAWSGFVVYVLNNTQHVTDLKVICAYGTSSTYYAHTDKGISISEYDTNKAMPVTLDSDIKKACNITQEDIDDSIAKAKSKNATLRAKNNCTEGDTDGLQGFICGSTIRPVTYEVAITELPISTPVKALFLVLLDLLVVLAVAEAGRRAFYYIALGKIKPPRK